MSIKPNNIVAFGIAAALLTLASSHMAVAASRFGVSAPKLKTSVCRSQARTKRGPRP